MTASQIAPLAGGAAAVTKKQRYGLQQQKVKTIRRGLLMWSWCWAGVSREAVVRRRGSVAYEPWLMALRSTGLSAARRWGCSR